MEMKEKIRKTFLRYDDSESFVFFLKALRAAQYFFMRADTARRFAGVMNGFPARSLGAGFLGFAGLGEVVRLDGSSEFAAVDGFVVILPAAALPSAITFLSNAGSPVFFETLMSGGGGFRFDAF